jgi:pimeloyl-ACP methyl ester carboxylesterase
MIGGMPAVDAATLRPTLVLLPGLACDARLWAPQAQELRAAGWSAVDSDAHERPSTLEAMAQRVLDAHDGPLLLAGASMGGMVALHAALRAPARIAGLVLVGSSARADTDEVKRLRADAIDHFEHGDIEPFLRINAPLALHPRRATDAALIERYLAMVLRGGVAPLIAQNRAVMQRPDLRPRLREIACPSLVLVGEADGLTPPEHARELATGLPHAELHVIEGAGHLPTLETPDAVTTRLQSWLAAQGW